MVDSPMISAVTTHKTENWPKFKYLRVPFSVGFSPESSSKILVFGSDNGLLAAYADLVFFTNVRKLPVWRSGAVRLTAKYLKIPTSKLTTTNSGTGIICTSIFFLGSRWPAPSDKQPTPLHPLPSTCLSDACTSIREIQRHNLRTREDLTRKVGRGAPFLTTGNHCAKCTAKNCLVPKIGRCRPLVAARDEAGHGSDSTVSELPSAFTRLLLPILVPTLASERYPLRPVGVVMPRSGGRVLRIVPNRLGVPDSWSGFPILSLPRLKATCTAWCYHSDNRERAETPGGCCSLQSVEEVPGQVRIV